MEDGRGSSGIGPEGILLPAEAVESNRSRPRAYESENSALPWMCFRLAFSPVLYAIRYRLCFASIWTVCSEVSG